MKKNSLGKYKIAIIGAGITGLYLGWKFAEKGYSVTIFERNKKIGNKVCSGLFSEKILDFVPESKKLIENVINYTTLNFPKKKIRVNFSKKVYLMSHSKLDKLVAGLAQKEGVKIRLNEKINKLPKGFDKIIGADGALSVVREELKLSQPKYRLGILGFENKEDISNYVETWPCCQNGFIWRIPRGKKVEYGIIAHPKIANKIFHKFLRERKIYLPEIKARLIPEGCIVPFSKRITLVGDAAGLTKPWSGGGVIWGLTASDILLNSFPNFLLYRRRVKRFFNFHISVSIIITRLVYFFGFHFPFFLPKEISIKPDFLFYENNKK